MKKIKLIVGDNFKDVNISAIKTIDKFDFEFENIIIVPDRSSLLIEKLIFDTLDISATFNIAVMGVSQLADLIFDKLGLAFEFVSKQESLLLVRKALINKKNELVYFNTNINNGLIEEIYNSIMQFKSNEVNFEQIKNSYLGEDELLKNKMQDLAIVFEEYEVLLNDRLDSTNVLSVLENATLQLDLKNYNFFYLNFDSFTKQGYSVLKNLIKTANNVTIGVIKAGIQSNDFIFEKDIFNKLTLLAKENKYLLTVETVTNNLNQFQNAIQKNLFALKPQILQSEFLTVFETQTIKEEVEQIAKQIKNLIFSQNAKYKNIAVACGNLEKYKDEIEKVFNEYDFNFYLDTNINLSQTSLTNFIVLVLNFLMQKECLQNFVISEFNGLDKNEKNILLDFIEKYNIQSTSIFEETKNENINQIKNKLFKNIKELINIKNNCKNIKNYINLIKNIIILFNLKEININLINNFKNKGLIKLEKIYIQIFDKLETVLNSFEKTIGEDKILFSDFVELFESVIKNQEMSTVPISVDSIFVGDATTSFFEEIDYLFVLGANENLLPIYLKDNGIIGDDVIEKISTKIELTPTVKMINRRNRFKVFNTLQSAKKHLYVSYSFSESDGQKSIASEFVKNLLEIFGEKNLKTAGNESLIKSVYEDKNVIAQNFAVFCGTKNKAKEILLKLIFQSNIANNFVLNSLFDILKNDIQKFYKNKEEMLEKTNDLFFKSNKTKISQIQKYFSCPFQQYVVYGLGLKEKENAVLNNKDIGIILHEVAHIFLEPKNKYIENIKNNKQNIEEIIKIIIKIIKNNPNNYRLLLKINKLSAKVLEEECKRLCEYLYYSQNISRFKPQNLEVYFGGENQTFDLFANNQTFKLVGVIDRVDFFNDMFIVIDYKTGKEEKSIDTNLYYGNKIQIFVYMMALKNYLKQKACGVYYFVIKNEIEEDSKNYMLQGKSIFDEKFLSAMDPSLTFDNPSSKIFSCNISTSKENIQNGEKVYLKKDSIEEETLQNMGEYSIKIATKAIEEMLDGSFEPSPQKGVCLSCPYLALCGFNGKCREKVYLLDKKFFENKKNKSEVADEQN
ncbi:MAG: PD-(D/E)XK nuclease family protein [Clostridia bacterium]|nr:PD-(D/E)XK nuclease family protein [Clostridia bacterium]